MQKPFRIFALSLLCVSAAGLAKSNAAHSAHAELKKADGGAGGHAKFAEASGGIRLTVDAAGLTPGIHGIHLHTTGACTPPDFASAGGHWNPTHKMHGHDSPSGMHMGDLPNITIDGTGKGHLDTIITGATFGSGELSLIDADGTALVIHAAPDDNKTDPSGNSGARLACGIVTAG